MQTIIFYQWAIIIHIFFCQRILYGSFFFTGKISAAMFVPACAPVCIDYEFA